MNDLAITGPMIAAVMKPGQSYHSAGLAKTFATSAANMRIALANAVAAGQIDHRTNNGVHLYSLMPEKAVVSSMKPYKVPREMRQAIDRCLELRVYPSKY